MRRSETHPPHRFTPQLALLTKDAPAGDDWLHEIKFDGYRIGCCIDNGSVRLLSRNNKDWTANLPGIRAAVGEIRARQLFLDGEVAVPGADGRTSFQALQNALGKTAGSRIVYFVFDLLHLDGESLADLPLEQRKARLQKLLATLPPDAAVRFSDHVIGHGAEFFAAACKSGLEGIVSKRRGEPYKPGRGGDWLKIKCIRRQEFVIGGFTDPSGSRAGLGALLVGVRNGDGGLVFAGKVGTGFTQRSAQDMRRRLEALEQRSCPFAVAPRGALGRLAHWVQPSLVAEVAFTEWTADDKIRHPSFQGLREDKRASEVVREEPVPHADPPPQRAPARTRRKTEAAAAVAGVKLTHPDRVLWPQVGQTKLDLARYYEEVAEWMLPHVAGRPLTLVRCPAGVGTSCFYMKHSLLWAPPALRRARIREKTKVGEYLIADDVAGLVALAQMDVLEIHTWNSRVDDVERPDRLVFDLDPGPEVEWGRVVAAAQLVCQLLAAIELESFVKTTGGKGLHVVVPLVPEADWQLCLSFARRLAELIARDDASYTTAFTKAGRERKILVDYLRNNRTNTSVAAFSTRAKPNAPVSAPLAWDELSARTRSDRFTIVSMPKRLRELRADPWKDYWHCKQRLTQRLISALENVDASAVRA